MKKNWREGFFTGVLLLCMLCASCSREEKAPVSFVTKWEVEPSFKYEVCNFAGIMTGREFYTRYYPELYAEWKKRLTPAAGLALKTMNGIIGPDTPPGPRLCLLLAAWAGDRSRALPPDSLSAILRSLDERRAVPRWSLNLAQDNAFDAKQWQAIKPHFRIFLEFLQKENFETYWRSQLLPAINRQAPYLRQELQAFDVIGDLERFLVDCNLPDTIYVHVTRLTQPHALRLPGQHYVTDMTYPIHVTVKSAYHELAHPYAGRVVDSLLAEPFKRLERDSFLQLTVARIDQKTGYKNVKTFFQEEVTMAAEMWVAERRRMLSQITHTSGADPALAARRYLTGQDEGIHVLAAVIFSYLVEGLKKDDDSYTEFLRMLFDSGRLAPGTIEERYNKFMNLQ